MNEKYQQCLDELEKYAIPYEIVEHPAATTTEEADHYIEGHEGIRTKTLFLNDRKKRRFYLIIADDRRPIDLKELAEDIGEKSLSFCSPPRMAELIDAEPGMVSLFALLNDEEHRVQVYLDRHMTGERITFHPNDNTRTLFMPLSAVETLLEHWHYTAHYF